MPASAYFHNCVPSRESLIDCSVNSPYATDGIVINRLLQANTRILIQQIQDLNFSFNSAFVANTEIVWQRLTPLLIEASQFFVHGTSFKMTEVFH